MHLIYFYRFFHKFGEKLNFLPLLGNFNLDIVPNDKGGTEIGGGG